MPVLTKEQVFEAVMELDDAARVEVIERLTTEEVPPLSPEQEADLREAIREYRENPHDARPWSDIKAQLLARI